METHQEGVTNPLDQVVADARKLWVAAMRPMGLGDSLSIKAFDLVLRLGVIVGRAEAASDITDAYAAMAAGALADMEASHGSATD